MNVVEKCFKAFFKCLKVKRLGSYIFLLMLDILIMWVMVKDSNDHAFWSTSIDFFKKSPTGFEWSDRVSPPSKAISQCPFISRMLNDRPFKLVNLWLSQVKFPSPKEFVQSHSRKQVFVLYQRAPFVFLLLMMV